MITGKWTFGVELERLAIIQLGRTLPYVPVTFKDHPGKPVAIPRPYHDLDSVYQRREYLRAHMPGLLQRLSQEFIDSVGTHPELVMATASPGVSGAQRTGTSFNHTEWNIEEEPLYHDQLLDLAFAGYILQGIEIISPALFAADSLSFEHIRAACHALQQKYWLLAPECTGLHIHVGLGSDWIPLRDLRRIAGLCYAADSVLVQLHPQHRRNNTFCPSNRLYSYATRGVETEMIEKFHDWHDPTQAFEDRELRVGPEGSNREFVVKPISTSFVRKVPRGNLTGYPRGSRPSTVFSPFSKQFLAAYPQLSRTTTGLPSIPSVVREILRCTDVRTVGQLMHCGPTRSRPAYNFCSYQADTYGLPCIKQTIEFRQPAGTLNADVTVAWARVAIRLCEWACAVDLETFWDMVVKCGLAESDGKRYDALDFLLELGLEKEAEILQGVLIYGDS